MNSGIKEFIPHLIPIHETECCHEISKCHAYWLLPLGVFVCVHACAYTLGYQISKNKRTGPFEIQLVLQQ